MQLGLCWTWSETLRKGFLATRLIYSLDFDIFFFNVLTCEAILIVVLEINFWFENSTISLIDVSQQHRLLLNFAEAQACAGSAGLREHLLVAYTIINEPHSEKTCLRGFRPGLTQIRLYSHRGWLGGLEISDLGSRRVVKTKALISCAVLRLFLCGAITPRTVSICTKFGLLYVAN